MRVGLAQESQVATQPSSSALPTPTDRVIGSLARNSVRLEATDRSAVQHCHISHQGRETVFSELIGVHLCQTGVRNEQERDGKRRVEGSGAREGGCQCSHPSWLTQQKRCRAVTSTRTSRERRAAVTAAPLAAVEKQAGQKTCKPTDATSWSTRRRSTHTCGKRPRRAIWRFSVALRGEGWLVSTAAAETLENRAHQ